MACVENIPPGNDESEMEEGEIVDDVDDLSDISSEEEFLLRQRLQVLENYNNVLERKKAKNSSFRPGKLRNDSFLHDLSEVSATELDDNFTSVTGKSNLIVYKDVREPKPLKTHHKQKKRKELDVYSLGRTKDNRKKFHHKKKPEPVKIISESSDESDNDEYRNKRRKLANAVTLDKNKIDKSSLQDRLQRMLCGTKSQNTHIAMQNSHIAIDISQIASKNTQTETVSIPKMEDVSCSPIVLKNNERITVNESNMEIGSKNDKVQDASELLNVCSNDDDTSKVVESVDVVDSVAKDDSKNDSKEMEQDSDEDLELLRQHALKTKSSKVKPEQPVLPVENEKPLILSEDEDSDTAELRLICLKSALLKKAIEMKQKQKLRKRLSQSSIINDDFLSNKDELLKNLESGNNTDIESVDMDIGSDADDKGKDLINEQLSAGTESNENSKDPVKNKLKDDELEEDEDVLRAKLLTSLSKNLPHLVDPNIIKTIEKEKPIKDTTTVASAPKPVAPEKRIIINLGESDSEGEHEATKNLTKMHMKLSEQIDFQQKLDLFLKSTRMEVEKQKLPDVVQKTVPKPEKFVAKTVNHLPKSEQIEYKNLVKRMAELQKIKEARQTSLNKVQVKDTLKPRNVTVNQKAIAPNKIEEQINLSRKQIAEESAKMMKLKEESTKLSQKYEIVATELKNIATAITLNKKQQRSVQNRLSKIRVQHQRLLNSSSTNHSKTNNIIHQPNRNKIVSVSKLQKENNPKKEELKNLNAQKAVKVSVINDKIKDDAVPSTRLSVQVDVSSNKKVVSLPNENRSNERVVDIRNDNSNTENSLRNDASLPVVEKGGGIAAIADQKVERRKKEMDDYESPLQALDSANWQADPNAILCPFEVGGNCKDADCKYLHPKVPAQ